MSRVEAKNQWIIILWQITARLITARIGVDIAIGYMLKEITLKSIRFLQLADFRQHFLPKNTFHEKKKHGSADSSWVIMSVHVPIMVLWQRGPI